MPDGMDPQSPEQSHEAPLDGVRPPEASESSAPAHVPQQPQEKKPQDVRKLLKMILIGGGVFSFVTVIFAFYLIASLPDPSGGGQGLTLFGNLYFGLLSIASVGLTSLIVFRLLKSGVEPARIGPALLRPGIVTLVILGLSGMVFVMINQEIPLSIDILEPQDHQSLTAPTTITFGTQSLRNILRKQSLSPKRYKWDFNGDGETDAETTEHEVTTVYRQKGQYRVVVRILLSNDEVRSATTRMSIPNAVFDVSPSNPIVGEGVTFDVSFLVSDPERLSVIRYDIDGDGQADAESAESSFVHTFTEEGTYQSHIVLEYTGGLQESYTRPVTVLAERSQPFNLSIETESNLSGSAPLGVILSALTEDGIRIREAKWQFVDAEQDEDPEKGDTLFGERVSYVFEDDGEFSILLSVTDTRGRTAVAKKAVSVLESLNLRDIVVTGSPRPASNRIEGRAPIEVKLSAETRTPFITFRWEQEGASRVYNTDGSYHALYSDAGTFPLVLIAEDQEKRIQKTTFEVAIEPPRSNISFTAQPSTGIAPLDVTFDASESFVPDGKITGFAWTFGDAGRDEQPQLLGARTVHRFETEGTFTVTVRALTEDGRSFDARKTIVVRLPLLDACVFPSRTTGTAPMGVRFDASCSTGDIASYLWDFGDGATAEQAEPVQDHVFTVPGSYEVELEIGDGEGKFDRTSVTISVE